MQNTYEVHTSLTSTASHTGKPLKIKAPSFFQAAQNTLRFLGRDTAQDLKLHQSYEDLRWYKAGEFNIEVLKTA